jgi:uncharacterized Zn finger protein
MPRCPACDCSGGHPHRVHRVGDPALLKIPCEIIAEAGDKSIYRCDYCGFIWYEWVPIPFGSVVQVPIGFYDNFTKPMEFFATPNHPLRRDDRPKKK